MAAHWAEGLAAGRYDGARDLAAFCPLLHKEGRAVSRDLHFGVRPGRAPRPEGADGAEFAELERAGHFGWRRLEILPGNVGYVDLRSFSGDERSGAVAAGMQFLAGVDALVIDLRPTAAATPR